MYDVARTPDGEQLLVGTGWSGVRLLSLSGEESETVPDIGPDVLGVTISPDGRHGAGVDDFGTRETRILVWDLASAEEVTNLCPEGQRVRALQLTDDGHLLSSNEVGLRRWNLETGESELLYEGKILSFAAGKHGKRVLIIEGSETHASESKRAVFLDLESGETDILETHGTQVKAVALDPESTIAVTGDLDGVVRIGLVTGEEPYLLLGHEHAIWALDIDPLGRWIASGGDDSTVRLWPMPDLSKPPLHTLPHHELIAKLKTLTNLRVVRDEESSTGWKLEVGPFPGWETVPTW
jgi:WD40 repeat protein